MSETAVPFCAIPTDLAHREARRDALVRTVQFAIEPHVDAQIQRATATAGADYFAGMAAALAVLVFRYTHQPLAVIGVSASSQPLGRWSPGDLVLQMSIDSQDTFAALIAKTAEAMRHENARGPATRFPTAAPHLVLSVTPDSDEALPADAVDEAPADSSALQSCDLLVSVARSRTRTRVPMVYDGQRFGDAVMRRLADHFTETVKSAFADPAQRLKDINIFPDAQRRRILVDFNGDVAPRPDKSVIDLLEEQCARTPARPAYICDGDVLTYEQANGKANSLALELHRMGVAKGDFIPLVLHQSLDLVISAFAVMKLGAAFVPMDTTWPAARIQRAIEELSPGVVLTDEQYRPAGSVSFPIHLVAAARLPVSATGHRNPVSKDDAIYGYYTSGSTGVPKCAVNIHRGIVNRFLYMTKRYKADGSEVILQNSKPVFDAWVWQVFWPLTNGARVVLPRSTKVFDLLGTMELIDRHQATMTDFVPSVFNVLVDYITKVNPSAQRKLASLRHILIGGEELNPLACHKFKSILPQVGLTNTYGPTETSIGTIFFEIGSDLYTRLPIGRPIDNVSALLLDDDLNLVPHGVIGEIYLGGTCVGAGYFNDPAQTRTRFLDNPYKEVTSAHIYRTGDLAYHLPDGNIQFVGRKDAQIKLRGVRIELGEIEATLLKHPEVREARVLLDKRVAGREELIAYIIGKGARVDVRSVRDHLRHEVPDYMVPAQFVVLDAFPLDHNGKVDRKRLLQDFAPETAKTQPDDPFHPRTPRETLLAEAWKETLQVNGIDRHDSFFDLGGNSLLGVRLICAIQEKLGVEISIHDLYRHPTIGELSTAIDAAAAGRSAGSASVQPSLAEIEPDLHCPDEIRGNGSARAGSAEFAHVLLTGATGFVGAHLLYELLESTNATVYCLVRAQGEVGALIRIRENLKYYGFDTEKHLSRIVPVPGDLSRPRFELSTDNYRDLTQRIDAVFHCGALVDYLRDYRGHRAANVLGTLEVLRFATTQQVKQLHHISTLGVFPLQDPRWSAQVFPEDGAPDRRWLPEGGYSQSKWAAEHLVYAARDRGVPCNVYRLGEVMPDTLLGVPNRKAMTHMMMSGLLALRMVPHTDATIDYLPADYVRRAVVHIASQPRWLGSTFNLRHSTGVSLRRVVEIFRSAGLQLEEVPYATFWKNLDEGGRVSGADNSLLLLRSMMAYGFDKQAGEGPHAKDVLRELFYMDAARVVDYNATHALDGSGITLPADETQFVRSYALHCKQLA